MDILCIGGPLDGYSVGHRGEAFLLRESFGIPLKPEQSAIDAAAILKYSEYRLREYRNDDLHRSTFRYVHETVTDNEAVDRIKREWGD